MRPERCLTKMRVNAFVMVNAPRKFVFKTVSHCSSDMRIIKPSRVTPALLTRMSMRLVSPIIFSPASATAAASETSNATAQAFRPAARTSLATFSEFSAVRETQTTSAPSAANFRAIARPIPRPAPVTTAI
jgi:hypothetical protein